MTHLSKIPNWLIKRSYLTPNRVAIYYKDEQITFKELLDKVKKVAASLHYNGIKKDDMVAVLLENKPIMIFILHALQLIGCKTILLNTRLQARELLFQLEDSEAKHLITEKITISSKTGVESAFSGRLILADQLEKDKKSEFIPVEEFGMNDICTIMYTSGTTGFPKGVIQTYGNHWWSAIGSALNLGLHANDIWLTAVPLFHISGFSILVRSVVYGIPLLLFEEFDEKEINHTLIRGKATIISVVSTMLKKMIDQLGHKNYHPNFRCMLVGGGSVPLSLLKSCKEKKIPVFQSYGLTETASQIVTLAPEDSMRKLGSSGKPLFPSQIKIMNQRNLAEINEIGGIFVKGPNVARGYLKRENANKESFTEDGWFDTGDMGYMDEEGFLYVVDRRTDIIISGGENIYPAEVEHVLLSHPAIDEAAVVGISDDLWGEVPAAFYVAGNSVVDEKELEDYCRKNLAGFKVPKRWVAVKKLPKNSSNKILRRELKKYFEKAACPKL